MNEFYLILVIVLFALAISNLIVGVNNDAINFLKSAIGSKSAPQWIIYGVAALGILMGATLSNGMMGIARESVFFPEYFCFSEIMIIFISVMVTNVILLNLFNAFGYPTSSTVSLIFELLGSAVAVSLTRINRLGEPVHELSKYINADSTLIIIAGILSSVVLAFVIGLAIQWITRFIFSFQYDSRINKYGAFYGGLCCTAITFFILRTGLKSSSIMSENAVSLINSHMGCLISGLFVSCTLFLLILKFILRIDLLKVIVLFGTFALAMSFSGNDLVNFIGVPLAGFTSFSIWNGTNTAPDGFDMGLLSGMINTPPHILLIAGAIMAVTLLTSDKVQALVKSPTNVIPSHENEDLYGSWPLSKFLVQTSISMNNFIARITPESAKRYISRQFKNDVKEEITYSKPDFDMLRAVTILMVSSILISIGTELEIPLSTSYVTFMVAMGTSLADRAWGRESATYRISGVFSVISGWVLTALFAFTLAFIVAKLISWGGITVILVLTGLALFLVIRTHISFKKKKKTDLIAEEEETLQPSGVLDQSNKDTVKSIIWTSKAFFLCFEGFFHNDRQQLKNAMQEIEEFNIKAKTLKDSVYKNVLKLKQDSIDSSHFYVQVVGYQRELAHSIHYVVKPIWEHFENGHKPFNSEQIEELSSLGVEINNLFNYSLHILKENKYESIDDLIEKRDFLVERLKTIEKSQIKRIKANDVSTKNSILFFNIISETKMLLLNLINLVKSQRDFNQEGKTKL